MINFTTDTFDHHSEYFSENRFDILSELSNNSPIIRSNQYGGFYAVSSYELANSVLSNPEVFSSLKNEDGSNGVTIPSVGPQLMPAETDAPLHTKLRRIAMPFYSPKALNELKTIVDEVITKLVDDVVLKKEFDIVADIAEMAPPLIGLRHMGFPEDQRADMVAAVKAGLSTEAPGEEAAAAFQAACGQMMQFVQQRRANPTDDLISRYIRCEDPVLNDIDIMWIGITLFVGGFKNPGAHISNALLHLGQDNELRNRLIADRSLIPKANLEFLRLYTAGNAVARTVTKRVNLGGTDLAAGDRVLVLLGGANRDPQVFENPDKFILNRTNINSHLAFGGGPHFCIGFKLANIMFERLLNEVFDRIPNYRVHAELAQKVPDAGIQAGYLSIPASLA